jgi:RNA polymerase sigma-70 factor, ECF subfamily
MTLEVLQLRAPPVTDALLLGRIAEGGLGALGELYDRHAPALLTFVRRTASRPDAEDIVQATFLRVISLAAGYDTSCSSAKPWLFGIAVRITRERRRAVSRLVSFLAELGSRPPPPSRQAEGARVDVENALARLSEAKRSVFLLAEVEGFSCQEVASILGVPVGTVWTRLHHARIELRRHFEETP